MNRGITQVGCGGIFAVLRVNALEVVRYFVKSFVPSKLLPAVRSAAHRMPEPVFIVVQILQRDCLRALRDGRDPGGSAIIVL